MGGGGGDGFTLLFLVIFFCLFLLIVLMMMMGGENGELRREERVLCRRGEPQIWFCTRDGLSREMALGAKEHDLGRVGTHRGNAAKSDSAAASLETRW